VNAELSVVIPLWSEGDNLKQLLPAIEKALEDIAEDAEVVVSCAPGRVPRGLSALANSFRLSVVEAGGRGYGDILRAGLERAGGKYVVTMDGDFSHRPGYLTTMWAHRDVAEFVIASRYAKGAHVEMGFLRGVLSRALNLFYRKVLMVSHRDISSGFRLFHRAVLDDIGPPEAAGLDALPEMLVKAVNQGWSWYQGGKPWSRARAVHLGAGYLATLVKMFARRNSATAADYDHRAFDSWIPLQRYWQRKRFEIVHEFVPHGDFVCDVGCGTSRIIQTLPRVVGVDLALRKLRWLRAPGRFLLRGSLTRLPFRDDVFDTLICSEVIEHVPRDDVDLAELVRVIHPGGTLVLSTPDYGRWTWRALEWLYAKVFPGGYVTEHINPYTRAGLRAELEGLGLEVLDCKYVGRSEMIFKARVPLSGTVARPARAPDAPPVRTVASEG
jgi:SAM-dependent methyltransferase